jgi:hypothetical protein
LTEQEILRRRERRSNKARERDMEVCCGRGRGKISTVEKRETGHFFNLSVFIHWIDLVVEIWRMREKETIWMEMIRFQ